MPETVYHDVPESLLGAIKTSCSAAQGTLTTVKNSAGTYSAVCSYPATNGAASITASDAEAAIVKSVTPTKIAGAIPSGSIKRTAEMAFLHPEVRRKVKAVQKKLDNAGIPMKTFETFRTPHRQANLYAQGRTKPGRRVSNAGPWKSYHQYGLAADFVRFENGKWNWDTDTAQNRAE